MSNAATKADTIGQSTVAAFNEAKAEVAEQVRRVAARRRKPDDREADDEIVALTACSRALEGLSEVARARVLLYLTRRYEQRPATMPGAFAPPVRSDPYPTFGGAASNDGADTE
jgi:hypothetical protein